MSANGHAADATPEGIPMPQPWRLIIPDASVGIEQAPDGRTVMVLTHPLGILQVVVPFSPEAAVKVGRQLAGDAVQVYRPGDVPGL